MTTSAQAKELIGIARKAIMANFDKKEASIPGSVKSKYKEKKGVFVSLYVEEELVGCIGYPEPNLPLWEAVKAAAIGAAFEDPRFPPLTKEQYNKLRVELSILTKPKAIEVKKASEYPSKVNIGKDGLVIRDEFGSGLLLPQVAVEWRWDSKEFLNQACMKVGLSPDCWNNMKRNVYKFQAEVFTESNGKIVKKV